MVERGRRYSGKSVPGVATVMTKAIRIKGTNGNSSWNRVLRDVHAAMASHLGGLDMITKAEEMLIRRIAVFEAEMREMEMKIAADRKAKTSPDEKFIDLYSRLANSQHRLLKEIGMKRIPRTVVPTLNEYLDLTKNNETDPTAS